MRFSIVRRGLLSAVVTTPTINRVTASGVKRQGSTVWLNVEDDGTANKWKFDVQANGVSLTGVTIRDGLTSTPASFPYSANNSAIAFDAPAALVGVPYTIVAYASADSGAHYGSSVTADENYTFPSTYFPPSAPADFTITRTTASGVTPMTITLGGGTFYDSDGFRIEVRDSTGKTLKGVSYIWPTTNGTSLDLDFTTAEPALPNYVATDGFTITQVSGDYLDEGGTQQVSGVANPNPQYVSPTDGPPPMKWTATLAPVGVAISGDGLTLQGSGHSGTARVNRGTSGGKGYVEFHVTTGTAYIGICDSSAVLPNGDWYNNSDPHAAILLAPYGQVEIGGAYTTTGQTFTDGDNIDVCWNESLKLAWWRKNNGAWLPTGDPTTGSGGVSLSSMSGTFYAAMQISSPANITIATQQSGYTRAAPSGYGT